MSMFTTGQTTVKPNGPPHPDYDTYAVTPSDSVDLATGSGNARDCRGFVVTGAGNVSVNLTGGGTALITGAVAGVRYVMGVTRILATSTTATGILALF